MRRAMCFAALEDNHPFFFIRMAIDVPWQATPAETVLAWPGGCGARRERPKLSGAL